MKKIYNLKTVIGLVLVFTLLCSTNVLANSNKYIDVLDANMVNHNQQLFVNNETSRRMSGTFDAAFNSFKASGAEEKLQYTASVKPLEASESSVDRYIFVIDQSGSMNRNYGSVLTAANCALAKAACNICVNNPKANIVVINCNRSKDKYTRSVCAFNGLARDFVLYYVTRTGRNPYFRGDNELHNYAKKQPILKGFHCMTYLTAINRDKALLDDADILAPSGIMVKTGKGSVAKGVTTVKGLFLDRPDKTVNVDALGDGKNLSEFTAQDFMCGQDQNKSTSLVYRSDADGVKNEDNAGPVITSHSSNDFKLLLNDPRKVVKYRVNLKSASARVEGFKLGETAVKKSTYYSVWKKKGDSYEFKKMKEANWKEKHTTIKSYEANGIKPAKNHLIKHLKSNTDVSYTLKYSLTDDRDAVTGWYSSLKSTKQLTAIDEIPILYDDTDGTTQVVWETKGLLYDNAGNKVAIASSREFLKGLINNSDKYISYSIPKHIIGSHWDSSSKKTIEDQTPAVENRINTGVITSTVLDDGKIIEAREWDVIQNQNYFKFGRGGGATSSYQALLSAMLATPNPNTTKPSGESRHRTNVIMITDGAVNWDRATSGMYTNALIRSWRECSDPSIDQLVSFTDIVLPHMCNYKGEAYKELGETTTNVYSAFNLPYVTATLDNDTIYEHFKKNLTDKGADKLNEGYYWAGLDHSEDNWTFGSKSDILDRNGKFAEHVKANAEANNTLYRNALEAACKSYGINKANIDKMINNNEGCTIGGIWEQTRADGYTGSVNVDTVRTWGSVSDRFTKITGYKHSNATKSTFEVEPNAKAAKYFDPTSTFIFPYYIHTADDLADIESTTSEYGEYKEGELSDEDGDFDLTEGEGTIKKSRTAIPALNELVEPNTGKFIKGKTSRSYTGPYKIKTKNFNKGNVYRGMFSITMKKGGFNLINNWYTTSVENIANGTAGNLYGNGVAGVDFVAADSAPYNNALYEALGKVSIGEYVRKTYNLANSADDKTKLPLSNGFAASDAGTFDEIIETRTKPRIYYTKIYVKCKRPETVNQNCFINATTLNSKQHYLEVGLTYNNKLDSESVIKLYPGQGSNNDYDIFELNRNNSDHKALMDALVSSTAIGDNNTRLMLQYVHNMDIDYNSIPLRRITNSNGDDLVDNTTKWLKVDNTGLSQFNVINGTSDKVNDMYVKVEMVGVKDASAEASSKREVAAGWVKPKLRLAAQKSDTKLYKTKEEGIYNTEDKEITLTASQPLDMYRGGLTAATGFKIKRPGYTILHNYIGYGVNNGATGNAAQKEDKDKKYRSLMDARYSADDAVKAEYADYFTFEQANNIKSGKDADIARIFDGSQNNIVYYGSDPKKYDYAKLSAQQRKNIKDYVDNLNPITLRPTLSASASGSEKSRYTHDFTYKYASADNSITPKWFKTMQSVLVDIDGYSLSYTTDNSTALGQVKLDDIKYDWVNNRDTSRLSKRPSYYGSPIPELTETTLKSTNWFGSGSDEGATPFKNIVNQYPSNPLIYRPMGSKESKYWLSEGDFDATSKELATDKMKEDYMQKGMMKFYYTADQKPTIGELPNRRGYKFVGWLAFKEDPSDHKKFIRVTDITKDLDKKITIGTTDKFSENSTDEYLVNYRFVAIWKPVEYSVTVDTDGFSTLTKNARPSTFNTYYHYSDDSKATGNHKQSEMAIKPSETLQNNTENYYYQVDNSGFTVGTGKDSDKFYVSQSGGSKAEKHKYYYSIEYGQFNISLDSKVRPGYTYVGLVEDTNLENPTKGETDSETRNNNALKHAYGLSSLSTYTYVIGNNTAENVEANAKYHWRPVVSKDMLGGPINAAGLVGSGVTFEKLRADAYTNTFGAIHNIAYSSENRGSIFNKEYINANLQSGKYSTNAQKYEDLKSSDSYMMRAIGNENQNEYSGCETPTRRNELINSNYQNGIKDGFELYIADNSATTLKESKNDPVKDNYAETAKQTVDVKSGSVYNRHYTAYWEPITYKITYMRANDANGSNLPKNNKANPTMYNIETPRFYLKEPEAKSGWTFFSWSREYDAVVDWGEDKANINVDKDDYETLPGDYFLMMPEHSIGDRLFVAHYYRDVYLTCNLNNGDKTNGRAYYSKPESMFIAPSKIDSSGSAVAKEDKGKANPNVGSGLPGEEYREASYIQYKGRIYDDQVAYPFSVDNGCYTEKYNTQKNGRVAMWWGDQYVRFNETDVKTKAIANSYWVLQKDSKLGNESTPKPVSVDIYGKADNNGLCGLFALDLTQGDNIKTNYRMLGWSPYSNDTVPFMPYTNHSTVAPGRLTQYYTKEIAGGKEYLNWVDVDQSTDEGMDNIIIIDHAYPKATNDSRYPFGYEEEVSKTIPEVSFNMFDGSQTTTHINSRSSSCSCGTNIRTGKIVLQNDLELFATWEPVLQIDMNVTNINTGSSIDNSYTAGMSDDLEDNNIYCGVVRSLQTVDYSGNSTIPSSSTVIANNRAISGFTHNNGFKTGTDTLSYNFNTSATFNNACRSDSYMKGYENYIQNQSPISLTNNFTDINNKDNEPIASTFDGKINVPAFTANDEVFNSGSGLTQRAYTTKFKFWQPSFYYGYDKGKDETIERSVILNMDDDEDIPGPSGETIYGSSIGASILEKTNGYSN